MANVEQMIILIRIINPTNVHIETVTIIFFVASTGSLSNSNIPRLPRKMKQSSK
ncbi:unnamed protein product [Schistosoma margrebowiei]|uniref:Uncharacterized protein n=1 Tax=Schistosoma margrebowiei TaxID=48269 RepID=A0A183M5U4_9TREM|nr:unnamed protein product [Schistosoma margrebowiei]